MSKYTLETTEELLTLPDDVVVQVSVAQVEPRDVPAANGREGWTKENFRFTILGLPSDLEEEYVALIGSSIFGSVSAKLTTHPDNKLRQWAEALLGFSLDEPGFELETEMLVGRKARGVIETYMKKDSTQRNHKIKALLPLAPVTVMNGPVSSAVVNYDEPPF